jgi:UDP-N-acetyl-D-mannosaminuronic acid dehydrogenase
MTVHEGSDKEVVVIGLGYVGLTLSVYLANVGILVHGVEISGKVLSYLENHRAFFLEKNLDEMLDKVIKNGSFSFSRIIPNVKKQRVFIITVGTPLTENLTPNLEFIKRAAAEVAKSLNDGDLVILRSTVKLGVTNSVVREILNSSNKVFSLAFCPERTLEGAALSEIGELPQIVGADSDYDKEQAIKFFNKVTTRIVPVSNIETAEIIKLVDNMQRDTHFAISNEVARMCNQVNIKASEVISAGKNGYPRTNLPTPGPVGGPCLEKDTYLLNDSFKMPISLSKTARTINELIIDDSVNFFESYFGDRISKSKTKFKISIIGLAFKGVPETNDLRGSMALRIIKKLKSKFENILIFGFDPIVIEEETKELGIIFVNTFDEAIIKSDLVLFMNNHPVIADINLFSQANKMNNGGMIYDYWGRFDSISSLPNGVIASSWGSHSVSLNEVNHD